MGWFSKLFSSTAAEPIEAVGNVFDKLFTSDEERHQAEAVMAKIKQHPLLLQAEINKVSATHRSVFVAGARPFIMWVCGVGILFAFVANPLLAWLHPELGQPEVPLEAMMELTLALLGLGALRTVEKIKGISK